MGNLGSQELFIIIGLIAVSAVVFNVVPYWFIFKKAGYHPALSLLMIIPLADIVMKFFLAFTDWPSLKKIGG